MKKIFTHWWFKYQLHILIWLIFVIYESVVIGLIYNSFGHPLNYLVHYLLAIFIFYFHSDIVLPWAFKNSKGAIWRVPLSVSIESGIYIFISFWFDQWLINAHIIIYPHFRFTYQYGLKAIYREIYLVGLATGYYFVVNYIKARKRTAELEKERLENIITQQAAEQELIKAQNAYLRAQINPHFLFNTLDFIYHHINELSPAIAEAVITLADMMRYAVDADQMGEFILLKDEIEQVGHFLYLNELRKNGSHLVSFNYTEEAGRVYLIPLVLLTLAENIYKHGVLGSTESPALFRIYIQEGALHIRTQNASQRNTTGSRKSTGLANIQKRLQLAYGTGIKFGYWLESSDIFTVAVAIPLSLLARRVAAAEPLAGTGTAGPHGVADPQ